jgi:SAM-dependent methyltransferase
VSDWTLGREDLGLRTRGGGVAAAGGATAGGAEAFPPPAHERALDTAARFRVRLRRFADLQFGSIWRDLAALLPQVRGTLVDVGAGAQPFRDLLPREVRYIAVDIEEAEQHFGYRAPETRYFRGARLPLTDGEAGTVLCTETLEHVEEPADFLGELRRVLSPGGRLILTVPFAARWHFVPHDYWRFTPAGLELVLARAGFREIRVYARGGALAVAGYKVWGLVLLLLAGNSRRGVAGVPARLLGAAFLPMGIIAVLAGHLGLTLPGTAEDTLGYTVLARGP